MKKGGVKGGNGGQRRKTRPPATLPALLAEGKSYEEIGDTVGSKAETVAKWAALPDIMAAVQRIQNQAGDAVRRRMAALQDKALNTLSEVMDGGEDVTASARVRASEAIFDRTGMPRKTSSEVQVSGGLDLDLTARSDDELDRELLEAAAGVALDRDKPELAQALKELAAEVR